MNIQIYQYKKNFDVQKAERFFKERRVNTTVVDLKKHKLGERELRLFAQKCGMYNLVDRTNTLALSHPVAHTDNADIIMGYLMENPAFLRTPIVRNGQKVALGADEAAWQSWLDAEK